MTDHYGAEGELRIKAQQVFGLAWYQDSRDGNICRIGRYDAQGNREVLGRGRDWQQAIDRASVTLNACVCRTHTSDSLLMEISDRCPIHGRV